MCSHPPPVHFASRSRAKVACVDLAFVIELDRRESTHSEVTIVEPMIRRGKSRSIKASPVKASQALPAPQ
jgi:hypothetical protein